MPAHKERPLQSFHSQSNRESYYILSYSIAAHSLVRRLRSDADTLSSAPGVTVTTHGTRSCERVLGKRPGKCLLAADLLAADKAVDGDGDGAVDVGACAVL